MKNHLLALATQTDSEKKTLNRRENLFIRFAF